MPPHSVYVEAFAGAGAVWLKKRPAARSLLIDRDLAAPALAMVDATAGNDGNDDSGRTASTLAVVGDGISLLEALPVRPDWLIYCDPPYMMQSRKRQRDLYRHEMTDAQHRQLLKALKRLDCFVVVSGYYSALYADRLKGWRCESFDAMTRGGLAREFVWMNYPEPLELHDCRYVGDGFRERERIKRKATRYFHRIASLPLAERAAVLAAVDDARGTRRF